MRKVLLLMMLSLTSYLAYSNASVSQKEWRWRKDNGTETTAAWEVAQDQAFIKNVCQANDTIRLRIGFDFYPDVDFQGLTVSVPSLLSYATSPSGPWTLIDTTTAHAFKMVSSQQVAHGTATTHQLVHSTMATFIPGKVISQNDGQNLSFSSPSNSITVTEHEWVILPTVNALPGTYYFRLPGIQGYPNSLPEFVVAPIVSVSASTTICEGGSATLTATGADSYSWSNGETTSVITVSPTATTTYTVTGTIAGCGSVTASTLVTVQPAFTATVSPGSASICAGGSVSLSASANNTNPIQGSALSFDGNGQHVSIPSFSFNSDGGDITIEFWAKINSNDVGNRTLFDFPTNDGLRVLAHVPWSNNLLYWDYGDYGTSNINGRIETDYSAYLNKWTHIAMVSEGKNGSFKGIYLDGVLVASSTISDGANTIGQTGLNLGTLGNPVGFKGSLDEFRVWNQVRTQTQIQQNMNSSVPAPDSGLVLNLPFNETTGTLVQDYSSNGYSATLGAGTNGVPARVEGVTTIQEVSYTWNPTTGLSANSGSMVTANPTSTTVYTLTANYGICTASASATINVTDLQLSVSTINASCNGSSDGSATVTASGGTAGYTYSWTNGSTSATATSLSAGTYTVTVTDANGCTASESVTITQPAAITATATANSPVVTGATIQLSATGGTSYTWTGPNAFSSTQQNPQILNAASANAGTYSVTVVNGNCSALATVTVIVQNAGTLYLTIDQTQPLGGTNFVTFTQAANYLNTNGVTMPTIIEVASGTGPYMNQLFQVGEILGASATNTITLNGNGNTLSLCSGNPLSRDIIRLDGTDHITINGLVLDAPCGNGWGVHLMNGNENVTISNNIITLNPVYSIYGANLQGIIASNSWNAPGAEAGMLNNITISGNTINHGYHGIRINGNAATWATNLSITGNTLNNTVAFGIVTVNTNALEVSENTISMKNVSQTQDVHSIGVQISQAENGVTITGNHVMNSGKQAMFLNYINQTSTTRGLIANNMLGGGFRFSAPVAVQFNYASYLDMYYNSTNADFGTGMGVYFSNAASTNLKVLNNSFAYTGASATGRAMQANNANTNFLQLDYNNYYSTGQMAWFNGAVRSTIPALQASMELGTVAHDMNSMSANPLYTSATDLHVQAASPLRNNGVHIASILFDIDQNNRSTTPTIGADEYTTNPVRLAPEVTATVYPNPFASELNLLLENAEGKVSVVLVDMMGREVYRNNYQATAAPINIQPNVQLAQGVYVLQVSNKGVVTQFRVVKQ